MHGIPSYSRYGWTGDLCCPERSNRPSSSPRAACVAVGRDPAQFAREPSLRLKLLDKGADIWEVRTLEDYYRRRQRLVTTARPATPATIDGPRTG